MRPLDLALFAAYLAAVVAIGLRATRRSEDTRGFFVAGRSMPWWAVGLSVMATQASAITFIGTTGQGYGDGLRFAQFYLGLPVAMAILAVTLVPLYHRADVYTAYELLGRRFDTKTRLLSALVFLLQRSLSLGVVVYAPSVVLSLLLGWSLPATVLLMTVLAIAYTAAGGIRAVMWTDVLQMGVVLVGLVLCFASLLSRLPAGAGLAQALDVASLTGRLKVLDFSFDPADRYTVWSGLFGGTLLFLSYFGCDQSQVQRFLSGRSLGDNRRALLLNAVLKLPVQLFVLLLGVLLFVVSHFEPRPLVHDPGLVEELAATRDGWQLVEAEHERAVAARAEATRRFWAADVSERVEREAAYLAAEAAVEVVRAQALAAARELDPSHDETNTVFPHYVLHGLPAGLAGLLLAAIFAAAMSSIDSELNALATTSVVDLYRPYLHRNASEGHYVLVSRLLTILWGAVAAGFALFAASLGSVIEAVNRVGSWFYGSLLGVFCLYAVRRANGHGAFAGLLAGMAAVAVAERAFDVAWLWLNPIGCAATVAAGWVVSTVTRGPERAPAVGPEPR